MGNRDSYAAASWNLLLNSFWRAGDLAPRATLRNWFVLLVSMFCLLRRSSSKFLFLWMSLYESICRCLSCSFLSRWILFRSALRACCCFCRSNASYRSIFSSKISFAVSASSCSSCWHCMQRISASSYLFEKVSFLTLSFISMSFLEWVVFWLASARSLSCSYWISNWCFSFNFSSERYAVAS